MSLATAIHRAKARPHYSKLNFNNAKTERSTKCTAKTNPLSAKAPRVSNTADMTIDEWVAHEKGTCSHSRAAEAAKRIRAVQSDKSCAVLNLYNCHLHSLPPLSGCQHVKYYRLVANYLMRVPQDIGDLPNLELLSLESNGLREVPLCSKYKNLRSLGVGGNPILEFPSEGLARGLHVSTNETLISGWQRKQFRQSQRRLKVQTFLRRHFSCLPNCCFTQPTDAPPTFDGGGPCDQNLKPFPYRQ